MFYRYFYEIKSRFTLIILGLTHLLIFCLIYKENLLYFAVLPFTKQFVLKYIVFTEISQTLEIYAHITKSLVKQTFICLSIYHCFLFISPGLNISEHFVVKNFCIKALKIIACIELLYHLFIFPFFWQNFLGFFGKIQGFYAIFFEPHLFELYSFSKKSYFLYCAITFFVLICVKSLSFEKKAPKQINLLRKNIYIFITIAFSCLIFIELPLNFLLATFIFCYFETNFLFIAFLQTCLILIR